MFSIKAFAIVREHRFFSVKKRFFLTKMLTLTEDPGPIGLFSLFWTTFLLKLFNYERSRDPSPDK